MSPLRFLLALLFLSAAFPSSAQDVFTRGLVYQQPAMSKVIAKENRAYRKVNDTTLHYDIYYPPAFGFDKKLPVVIFNNGAGGLEVPRWAIYKDWAKLMAANNMIAVVHQSRSGSTLDDGAALIDHLMQHAAELNIDTGKIGLWTCSANARTGMRLAHKTRPQAVKTLVVYYGNPDSLGQLRQDLPTLVVRAGLDAQMLNMGIDNFIQASLQQDTRIELINYLEGIHAFDAFTNSEESISIIQRTVEFFKKNLNAPAPGRGFVLTNRNFMWLVMSDRLPASLDEFRKARTMYRNDPNFHPFYNAVIREDVLNTNAYWLLNHQRPNDALALFQLAVESYPESPNAYESLSEAYERAGNRTEAVKNAERCLEKLSTNTSLNERFKQQLKNASEERIRRLGAGAPQSVHTPQKRAHHHLVYDESSHTVLLSGGSTPLNGGQSFAFFNDLWQFDGKGWKKTGAAGNERSGFRMVYHSGDKKIYSFGGFANNTSLGDLRVLENGNWRTLSDMPEMKAAEPGFVYDRHRNRLIAFGGSGSRDVLNSTTWQWNGSSWTKWEGTGPSGRQAFVMAYDSKRKKTVLFGGMGTTPGSLYKDTWEFDGERWELVDTSGPARMAPGFAYDEKSGQLLIFGGMAGGGSLGDTWAWDGKKWKQVATSGPPPRSMGYMAFDAARNKTILFGGRLEWPNDANDTWEWDGKSWKVIP